MLCSIDQSTLKEPLDRDISYRIAKSGHHPITQDVYKASNAHFYSDRIELVRNRFVYEKIFYINIDEIIISKGFLIKNRWIIRGLSIAVIITMIVLFYSILTNANNELIFPVTSSTGSNGGGGLGSLALLIYGPFALIALSLLAFYQSTLTSNIIKIRSKGKSQDVRVRKIDKKMMTEELLQFLINQNNLVIDKRT